MSLAPMSSNGGPSGSGVRLRVPLRGSQAVPETSAVAWLPQADEGAPGVVLAHGAGADMTSVVLCTLGRGLCERGFPVLAFNFPYAEAGRKRPDPQPRLERAFADVVDVARETFGPRPLVLGGRSMGGRIASHLAADGVDCDGLVLLSYPLHPPGRPERLRTAHWPRIDVPVLFVHGDRDSFSEPALFTREIRRLPTAPTVHIIPGADHGFAIRGSGRRAPADVLNDIVDTVADWLTGEDAGHAVAS